MNLPKPISIAAKHIEVPVEEVFQELIYEPHLIMNV